MWSWRRYRRGGDEPETDEEPRKRADLMSAEIDILFGPSRKHVHERKEWVAVAKVDDHEAGAGPIDLESGVVSLRMDGEQPV